jgi:hypothetical protein
MTLSWPSFFAASTSLSMPPRSAALAALAASVAAEPPLSLDDGGAQATTAANAVDAARATAAREIEVCIAPPSARYPDIMRLANGRRTFCVRAVAGPQRFRVFVHSGSSSSWLRHRTCTVTPGVAAIEEVRYLALARPEHALRGSPNEKGRVTTDDGYPAAGHGRHRNDWDDNGAQVDDDGAQNRDGRDSWQRDPGDEDAWNRGVQAYWGNDAEYNAVPDRPHRPLQWPSQVSRLQREQAADEEAQDESAPEESWWDESASDGPSAGQLAHELPGRIEPQWQNFSADGRELTPWRAFGDPEPQQPAQSEPGYDQAAYGQRAYEAPEPGYDEREPAYEAREPGYDEREPGYDEREPAYEAREPGYEAPEPAYGQPSSAYSRLAADYGEPLPDAGLPDYGPPEQQWRGYDDPQADATSFVVDFAPNLRRRLPEPEDAGGSPDEEEEEEGRRRVPALLIAAIVGVVLLGLGIWARWPRDTSQASSPQRPGVVTSAPVVADSGSSDSPAVLPPAPSDIPTTGPTPTKRVGGGTTPTTRATTRSPTPGTTTTTAGPSPTPTPTPSPTESPTPSPTPSPTASPE